VKKSDNHGLLWSFVVMFFVLLIDQVFKIWVKTNMTLGQEIPVLGKWFKLLFIENEGMAFGWLGNGGVIKLILSLFRIAAVVALFIIIFRLSKKDTQFGVLFGLSLITAGAMGNIIDCVFYGRIFSESTYNQVATLFPAGGGYANWLHGRVVDMFSFSIFPPIFNFADAAITVGVFYMLIFQWKWLKTL